MRMWITAFGVSQENKSGGNFTSRNFLYSDEPHTWDLFEFLRHDVPLTSKTDDQFSSVTNCNVSYSSTLFFSTILFFIPPIFLTRISPRSLFIFIGFAKKCQHIHLEFSQVLIYALIAKLMRLDTRVTVRLHDVQSEVYGRKPYFFAKLYSTYIGYWESLLLSLCDCVYVPSHKDEELLSNYGITSNVCVDSFDWMYKDTSTVNFDNNKIVLGFHGNFERYENVEAFKFINNVISKSIPECIEIIIFGQSSQYLKSFKPNKNITIVGPVDNIHQFIIENNINVGLIPLSYGAGIKVKVLDYVHAGSIVLATSIGAEGISSKLIRRLTLSEFVPTINRIYTYGIKSI